MSNNTDLALIRSNVQEANRAFDQPAQSSHSSEYLSGSGGGHGGNGLSSNDPISIGNGMVQRANTEPMRVSDSYLS